MYKDMLQSVGELNLAQQSLQSTAIATRCTMADYLHTFTHTIRSLGRCSAVLHTTFVPPPEVPRGCGLKGRGQGWTGPKTANVAQLGWFSEEYTGS